MIVIYCEFDCLSESNFRTNGFRIERRLFFFYFCLCFAPNKGKSNLFLHQSPVDRKCHRCCRWRTRTVSSHLITYKFAKVNGNLFIGLSDIIIRLGWLDLSGAMSATLFCSLCHTVTQTNRRPQKQAHSFMRWKSPPYTTTTTTTQNIGTNEFGCVHAHFIDCVNVTTTKQEHILE